MISELLERFHDWQDRRAAFRDLRRQKAEDAPYDIQEQARLINQLRTAAYREHAGDGLAAWNALYARAPDVAITSTVALRAMMWLKHFAQADAALAEAQEKFPGHAELARLYADSAHMQGHWDVACERWSAVRKKHPGDGAGYTFGASVLSVLGRYEEADKLLEHWMKVDPTDSQGAAEYARMAENLGNLPVAMERWRRMQETIHDVVSWIGEAKILTKLGRETEALEVLRKAQWKFESSPLPEMEICLIVQVRGDHEESLRQWARFREHFPAFGPGYVLAAWILRDLGRLDEAEALLLLYVSRDLAAPEPAIEYARLAHGRQDWKEAARRWAAVRERYPEQADGFTWGAVALEALGEHAQAAEIRALGPVNAGAGALAIAAEPL